MTDDVTAILSLPTHPFFIGLIGPEARHRLPETLPFALGVHSRYAIPRLIMSDETRVAVDQAYAIGSMCSTPLGESRLAERRMDEFRETLLAALGPLKDKRLLEIGSGTGMLLRQLRDAGALVTGLEIGPQADLAEQRYGIRMIRDPLAPGSLREQFDCIYSYGCLEHIGELDSFLAGSRECLVSGGLFFHSVPNAALSFANASLEHLQHEHVNYFTPENATALFEAQGFRRAQAALTRAGNELMVWGWHDPVSRPSWPDDRIASETAMLTNYARRLEARVSSTLARLYDFLAESKSIGFYAGGYDYGIRLGVSAARYFDGDTFKHGKRWLPSLPPIEPPEMLHTLPVDRLIVCKPHYFHEIKRSLIAIGLDTESILSIDSISEP